MNCKATVISGYAKGMPCRSIARDSGFCFWHDPVNAERVAATAKKSQETRRANEAAGIPSLPQRRWAAREQYLKDGDTEQHLSSLIHDTDYLKEHGWSEDRILAYISGWRPR